MFKRLSYVGNLSLTNDSIKSYPFMVSNPFAKRLNCLQNFPYVSDFRSTKDEVEKLSKIIFAEMFENSFSQSSKSSLIINLLKCFYCSCQGTLLWELFMMSAFYSFNMSFLWLTVTSLAKLTRKCERWLRKVIS